MENEVLITSEQTPIEIALPYKSREKMLMRLQRKKQKQK